MGILKGIHHVEMLVKNMGLMCDYFTNCLGFNIFCIQKNGNNYRTVVRNGKAVFVLRNIEEFTSAHPSGKPTENVHYNTNHAGGDTVYNIALEVSDVQKCYQRIANSTASILPPTTISDYYGTVKIAIVKSCLGNVIHTLLDTSCYKGLFLPGYTSPQPVTSFKPRRNYTQVMKFTGYSTLAPNPTFENTLTQHVTHMDHITFACYRNQADNVINWYHDMFQMEQCKVNNQEDIDDGFVVEHNNNGLRLKAFDYWKCQKRGIETEKGEVKFVVAEPLMDSDNNQITTFLREHSGPGIQHIGLHTSNIVQAVTQCRARGANLMSPPPTYYSTECKRIEIHDLGLDLEILKQNGILIDTEEDSSCPWDPSKKGFLMQVFTKPLFTRDTFFLEFIQRCGADGFGAGNIRALWQAVDNYMLTAKSKA